MKLITTILLVIWLCILTASIAYLNKAALNFLKFEEMMIDDNLKNVVVSSGETFYVVGMKLDEYSRGDKDLPVWYPVYVTEDVLGKLVDRQRKEYVMVKNFQEMELQAEYAISKADRYFKSRLKDVQAKKEKSK